jgi:hypothetical protein
LTAKDYAERRLPWFSDYAGDRRALAGETILSQLKSVFTIGKENGRSTFSDDDPVSVGRVLDLRQRMTQAEVRDAAKRGRN